MTDDKQLDQFKEALEKKNEEAAAASAESNEQQLVDTDESQDTYSVRDKSSRHKKMTADKWNQ